MPHRSFVRCSLGATTPLSTTIPTDRERAISVTEFNVNPSAYTAKKVTMIDNGIALAIVEWDHSSHEQKYDQRDSAPPVVSRIGEVVDGSFDEYGTRFHDLDLGACGSRCLACSNIALALLAIKNIGITGFSDAP